MNWKKILVDPSFWILLIANLFLIYKYVHKPDIFNTLIWLYWSQSVLYGFFNFLDILTSKNVDVSGFELSWGANKSKKETANAAGWFFLLHFGAFHLGYSIFLFAMSRTGHFEWGFYKNYLWLFFGFQVINFIQHKIQNRKMIANIRRMFFIPYLRVVPMHLTILIPAFFHVKSLIVFLVLKVLADVIMYIITTNYYQTSNLLSDITAVNIQSTLSSE